MAAPKSRTKLSNCTPFLPRYGRHLGNLRESQSLPRSSSPESMKAESSTQSQVDVCRNDSLRIRHERRR
eukprot:720419-Prymnesium_polylepis.1